MKKAILNMLMLFAVTGVATAQTVTVADVEALPGETVKATLELSAPAGTYTGVQLFIQFPTTGFSNVVNGAGTSFGFIQVGAMTDGKVKIAAAADNFFEDATIVVQFTVDGSLDLGEYPVTVSGQFEATGVVDPIADVPFKVNVVERHTVVLDELATTAPAAATGVNVKVKRTIKKDEWSTICLPFAMDATQVKAAFGDDVLLKDFTSWSSEEDDEGNIVSISIGFASATSMEANHPYLIKVSSIVNEFTVNSIDITPTATPKKEVGKGKKKGTFYGTFAANTTVPENKLFLNDNKFWYSKGSTKIKAFRGYFDLYDILTSAEEASTRIDFNFDETTGIKEVHGNANVEGTYDLQGRKVEEPVKGLYIVNGHKVVIK